MLNVRNPRTGQNDYTISPLAKEELIPICHQLRQGQLLWHAQGIDGRIRALQAWKNAIKKYEIELVEAISKDTGRKSESILEVQLMGNTIDRWCGIAKDFFHTNQKKKSSIPFIDIEQDVVPFALVGVISPWNFPLLLSIIDTIPALLAGCAVIVKPSEVTPRFIKVMRKTIEEIPELTKVFTYIEGEGKTGADMVELVDLVCFTGSVATGRKVYQSAATHFIPAFLELGGKDPALVFEGAAINQATSALLWGSVVNAGQSCLSIERIYVQDTIYEEFIELLVKKTNNLKFAYPNYESGQIGPIISDKQAIIIQDHLEDAYQKGAKSLTGGKIEHLGGGIYCFPTVLVNVNHSMKIMTEETFGPIMPIMSFKTKEEAIALANSTVFGLSGAVFAKNNEEAIAIGKQIQGGAISINECALTAVVHEGEKNSFKASGLGGTRMGAGAIRRFMRQKAFLIKNQAINSPWWF
ncbi:MAG: aldehyde dehydrogenase family protein [Thermoflexibacter sp.]|jgi:acyl-CoA reductase-like NAD-dependent aldehyde dehydrogenase|nr:aldehyde dehydrogenase family protein [Thermoflexibacter sp.]